MDIFRVLYEEAPALVYIDVVLVVLGLLLLVGYLSGTRSVREELSRLSYIYVLAALMIGTFTVLVFSSVRDQQRYHALYIANGYTTPTSLEAAFDILNATNEEPALNEGPIETLDIQTLRYTHTGKEGWYVVVTLEGDGCGGDVQEISVHLILFNGTSWYIKETRLLGGNDFKAVNPISYKIGNGEFSIAFYDGSYCNKEYYGID